MEKSVSQKSKEKRAKNEYCRKKHGLGYHWSKTLEECVVVPGFASALAEVRGNKAKNEAEYANQQKNSQVNSSNNASPKPNGPAPKNNKMQTVKPNSNADAAIKAEVQKRTN